jgi:PleD family two-component response regulator
MLKIVSIMSDENRILDMPALLRLGYVDIRRVLRNSPSIQVKEYFHLVYKLVDHAPIAIKAIAKAALKEATVDDLNSLEIVKLFLEDIGNIKFFHELDDLVITGRSGRRGHDDAASSFAKRIAEDLTRCCKRIVTTVKTEDKLDSLNPKNFETEGLKDFLTALEEEEASRKLRILAVDDTPVILKTILAVLSHLYKVDIMPDPTRVEKFLEQITPDFIILDYQMPVLNGIELSPIIRKFEEHKDTPIVFLTSEGTTDLVSKALSLGACDFMVKPFQPEQLIEKVAKHIVRKKLY